MPSAARNDPRTDGAPPTAMLPDGPHYRTHGEPAGSRHSARAGARPSSMAISRLDAAGHWGDGTTGSASPCRTRVLQRTYSTRFNDFALEHHVGGSTRPGHPLHASGSGDRRLEPQPHHLRRERHDAVPPGPGRHSPAATARVHPTVGEELAWALGGRHAPGPDAASTSRRDRRRRWWSDYADLASPLATAPA